MGIRLYPNTTNPASLETLAGVPAGTYNILQTMREKHRLELESLPYHEQDEVGYKHWKELQKSPAGELDAFLTFGWGKFSPVDSLGEDYSGSIDNIEQAQKLLQHNGIEADANLTEGVHWC